MLADHETLQEVGEADEVTLRSMGITRHQLADALELAIESAKTYSTMYPTRGAFTLCGRRYTVELQSYMGFQESPFGGVPSHSEHLVRVTAPDDSKYCYGGALPHMIRHNGFFQGATPAGQAYQWCGVASFRVDPSECARFFGVYPGQRLDQLLAVARATPIVSSPSPVGPHSAPAAQ